MSYDYNDLLGKIIASRQHHPDSLHETLDLYAVLSDRCSMTPMLWLQYAQDARLVQDSLATEIIQLALDEFPGCVILWIYYLDMERDWKVWIRAKEALVGSQDGLMLDLYRLAVRCFISSFSQISELYEHRANHIVVGNEGMGDEMRDTLTLRGNFKDDLTISSELYQHVELGRRFVSQNLALLQSLEEDIRVALNSEGLLSTVQIMDFIQTQTDDPSLQTCINWESYLSALGSIQGKFLMGYGMEHVSSVFLNAVHSILQHIRHLKKNIKKANNEIEQQNHDQHLVQIFTEYLSPLYERAISECPTVELIWEKYMKHLLFILNDAESSAQDRADALISLKNVSARAVKNCPYSVKLFTFQMQVVVEEVDHGSMVFEPDDLMKIVQEAVDAKFLVNNQAHLDVHLAACTFVKRRILEVVSKSTSFKAYDSAEQIDKCGKNSKRKSDDIELVHYPDDLPKDIQEEVQDLIADLRDMFEETDSFLKKHFQEWTEGREILYKEIANTEAYVLASLSSSDSQGKEVVEAFEKLLRIHSPPHPNSWRSYIQYLLGRSVMKVDVNGEVDEMNTSPIPGMAVAKFRFIRNMYHRAIPSIKKLRDIKSQAEYEYESAARSLYQEYIEFERMFGSESSYKEASILVSKKIGNIYAAGQVKHAEELVTEVGVLKDDNQDDDATSGKRKALEDEVISNSKRSKVDHSLHEIAESNEHFNTNDTISSENSDQIKKPVLPEPKKFKSQKVKVGNSEHSAHPYTVHVSNLSLNTMDSDLYHLFRPLCGDIVHCRIFRDKTEKYHVVDHGDIFKSKCEGLIQFQEKDSVEKALSLSGEIGIHEKLITVTRSHQSAVSVVPPGMHRTKVASKRERDNTKRNEKRKERRMRQEHAQKTQDSEANNASLKEEQASNSTKGNQTTTLTSVLSFRPRNVKAARPKRRI